MNRREFAKFFAGLAAAAAVPTVAAAAVREPDSRHAAALPGKADNLETYERTLVRCISEGSLYPLGVVSRRYGRGYSVAMRPREARDRMAASPEAGKVAEILRRHKAGDLRVRGVTVYHQYLYEVVFA